MNPFEVLEVPADASPDDIRAAYHRLAKQWHPDRFTGTEKAQAEEKFRQVADAFAQLKDPLKRQALASSAPKSAGAAPAAGAKPPAAPPPAERTPEDWAAEAKWATGEGNLDQAKGLIQYAIRLAPSRADFHAQLADVLERLGDPRGAIRALETAQRLNPKDVEVLIRLADHFGAQGMRARQARMLDEAKAIDPGHRRFKPVAEKKPHRPAAPGPEAEGILGQVKGLLNRLLKKE